MHADQLEENGVRLQSAHDEIGRVRHILLLAGYDDVASALQHASVSLGGARLLLLEEVRNARDDNS